MDRTLRDRLGEALWLAFQNPLYPRVGWIDVDHEDTRKHWIAMADDVIVQANKLLIDIVSLTDE